MKSATRLVRLLATTWILSPLAAGAVHAAPLADNVRLISANVQAAQAAPVAQTFIVTNAGTYTVQVTDLAIQGPLPSLSVAVATSVATATQLTVVSPATTASADVVLDPGTYTVQPLADGGELGGAFTVSVTPKGSSTALFVGPWAVPASAASSPPGQTAQNMSFMVTDTGSYTLTVTDRAFPAALSAFQAVVLREPDGMTVCTIASLATPNCTMALAAGTTYDLVILANADAAALAGLCSLNITGGSTGSSVPFATTIPVGGLASGINVQVPAAEAVTVQLKDTGYPVTLASLRAVVVEGADLLQQFGAQGSASVSAVAGKMQVFVMATPDAARGEGAYVIYAHDAAGTLTDVAVPVTDATHVGYAYSSMLAASGNYQMVVTDYLLPSPLVALDAFAEQNGQQLATGIAAVPAFAAQTGRVNMLAFAAAPAAGTNGLFGIDLTDSSSGNAVFQTTQGVGASFQTIDIVASAGKYVAQLTDLGFPADFAQVWVIGTGNRQVVTQILIGQGTSTGRVVFDVPSGGTYVINVLAQTGTGQQYGLYGFNLAAAPPAATVTLTADAVTVNSGGKVTLAWSSTDATSCTASDGWSGTLATSGSQDSSALSATTTFTLTCTGDGGSGSASAQVQVTQPPASGGGGGGALDRPTLLMLALGAAWALRRRAGMSERPSLRPSGS